MTQTAVRLALSTDSRPLPLPAHDSVHSYDTQYDVTQRDDQLVVTKTETLVAKRVTFAQNSLWTQLSSQSGADWTDAPALTPRAALAVVWLSLLVTAVTLMTFKWTLW